MLRVWFSSTVLLLLGLVSHSYCFEKRVPTTTVCIKGSCLAAVSSAAITGSADCSKFELAVAPVITSSTYTVVTVTVTGIETVWVPTISYLVWDSTSTSPSQSFTPLPAETVSGHNTTIPVKRDIVPRATSATIPSYASACSSSAAYASACSCIGVNVTPSPVVSIFTTTVTKTIPTSTTTATATFTREVCAPQNNYGFIYGEDFSIYVNNPNVTSSNFATFREWTLNRHDCCAACYTAINGCYLYRMDVGTDVYTDGTCQWAILNTGGDPSTEWKLNIGGNTTLTPDSPHCPNGNTWVTKTTPGNAVGAGPCVQRWLDDAY